MHTILRCRGPLEDCELGSVKTKTTWYTRKGKRYFDVVASLLLLLIFSPAMASVAGINCILFAGKVCYVETRICRGGREFRMWKFRSMKEGVVTRFGGILRYTALDELPQFFHVLIGQMSLVGPRPHSVAHYERAKALCPCSLRRIEVRPGMTGLAQLRGHHDSDDEARTQLVRSDSEYLARCSFWLDLKLLGRSLFVFFTGH